LTLNSITMNIDLRTGKIEFIQNNNNGNDSIDLSKAELAYVNSMKGYISIWNPVINSNENPSEKYDKYVESKKRNLEKFVSRIQCGEIYINNDDVKIVIDKLDTLYPLVSMGDERSNNTIYYNFNFYSNRFVGYFYSISLSTLFDDDIITIKLYMGIKRRYDDKSFKSLKYIVYKNGVELKKSRNFNEKTIKIGKKVYEVFDLGPTRNQQRNEYLFEMAEKWNNRELERINKIQDKNTKEKINRINADITSASKKLNIDHPHFDWGDSDEEFIEDIKQTEDTAVEADAEADADPIKDAEADADPIKDAEVDADPIKDAEADADPIEDAEKDASRTSNSTPTSIQHQSNYIDVDVNVDDESNMIDIEKEITKDIDEFEHTNNQINLHKLATFYGLNLNFIDKLQFFIDLFKEGWNIDCIESHDMISYSLVVSRDDEVTKYPL
jgi:hypothetical protein